MKAQTLHQLSWLPLMRPWLASGLWVEGLLLRRQRLPTKHPHFLLQMPA